MPNYYRLNSLQIKLWEFSGWIRIPVAAWYKLLGRRLNGPSDLPPVDALTEFGLPFSEWPDEIQKEFISDLEGLRSRGIVNVLPHRIHTPDTQTTLYRISLLDASGTTLIRLQLRESCNADYKSRVYSRQLSTVLTDGLRLVTSSHPPARHRSLWSLGFDINPPAIRVNRLVALDLDSLAIAHRQRIEDASRHDVHTRQMPELETAVDGEHNEQFQYFIERGLFEPLPPHADPSDPDTQFHALLEGVARQRVSFGHALGTLVVSVVAYLVIAGFYRQSFSFMLTLVPILFFHELGHWLTMKAFGYQQMRMLFVPSFGAVVTGRQLNATSWQKSVVYLMGPLPGILLGMVIAMAALHFSEPHLFHFSMLMLILNAANLLPILPLDGGQILESLVFCRSATLEILWRVLAAGAVFACFFVQYDPIALIIAALLAYSIRSLSSVRRAVDALQSDETLNTVSPDGVRIPPETAQRIASELRSTSKKPVAPALLAGHVLQVFGRLNARPPGAIVTTAMLALYILGLGGSIFATSRLLYASAGKHEVVQLFERVRNSPSGEFACGNWSSLPPDSSPPQEFRICAAHFPSTEQAQAAFASFERGTLPGPMSWFGSTVMLSYPRARRDLVAPWQNALSEHGAKISFVSPEYSNIDINATAPSNESASAMSSSAAEYFAAPSFMNLLPPWSPNWRNSPRVGEWQRNRRILRDLSQRAFPADSSLKSKLNAKLQATFERADPIEIAAAQQEWNDVEKHEWTQSLTEMLESSSDPDERMLIAAYLGWKLDQLSARQIVPQKSRTDESGRLTPVEFKLWKAGSSCGQWEDSRSSRVLHDKSLIVGHVHRTDRGLRFSLNSFDPAAGLREIAQWLCDEGCTELTYSLSSPDYIHGHMEN